MILTNFNGDENGTYIIIWWFNLVSFYLAAFDTGFSGYIWSCDVGLLIIMGAFFGYIFLIGGLIALCIIFPPLIAILVIMFGVSLLD